MPTIYYVLIHIVTNYPALISKNSGRRLPPWQRTFYCL